MFRHSQGQISGTRSLSFFSSDDLPKIPDVIQTYSYTGANQDILVPAGYSSCEYIIWGAAGSRAFQTTFKIASAGGSTTGILAVTGGETLIAIVGEGGLSCNSANLSRAGGYGGAGSISTPLASILPGRGGGRSAIRRASTELATAGGAGGGAYPGTAAGVGGGTTGGASGASGGGTQSAGGAGSIGNAGNATSGTAFQGGNGGGYGGSGGGGFFGGGGGANATGNAGGGGGSGFAGGTSALTYQGVGATPPLNTDPRYPGGGVGTSNDTNDQAGHGFIHLRFFI